MSYKKYHSAEFPAALLADLRDSDHLNFNKMPLTLFIARDITLKSVHKGINLNTTVIKD